MTYRCEEDRFDCSCGTESVTVATWNDSTEIYFCMWNMTGYGPNRLPWRHRLRSMWRIARKGEPYLDQIVLGPDDALRLGSWLVGHAKVK